MSSSSDQHQPLGYEKRDANVKVIVVVSVLFLVFLVISAVLLNEYFLSAKDAEVYDVYLKPESKELLELRDSENEILNSYKLIDTTKQVYRIPIDRAMEIVAREAAASN
jgi:hypothetical protein